MMNFLKGRNEAYPIDKISFEVVPANEKRWFESVEIFINGHSLIEILRQVELPFAKKEGSKSISGGYSGLPSSEVFLPSKHFFGQPNSMYDYEQKVSVLECQCGNAGCWPFLVKISADGNFVVWSDYEQPYRGEAHPSGKWNYEQLPSFRFDRVQYEKALSKDPKYFKIR